MSTYTHVSRRLIVAAFVALGLFWISLPSPAAGQGDKAKCDPSSVITKANALKSSKDAKADLIALNTLTQDISAVNIACNGLTFKGKGTKVYDPFTLPAGTYRVKLTNSAIDLADVNLTESRCGIFASSTIGEESVLRTEGCRAVMSVTPRQNESAEWTVTFELLE